ncbi:MAG: hypothetical protein KKC39_00290, partial [Candidatus Omnitrophica bacterium]|nr:hypothetical protein [Candidatus Omnitrophota bacterium]MBU4467172.1 hypothetical protein [Candidatus Omnitrophota bacterium]MCG2707184.1 hypothetical protein [Candidatus Omnitrophota bacterium]
SGGLKAVSYPTISHLKLCADGQLAQPKHLIRLDYKELILARNKVLSLILLSFHGKLLQN